MPDLTRPKRTPTDTLESFEFNAGTYDEIVERLDSMIEKNAPVGELIEFRTWIETIFAE